MSLKLSCFIAKLEANIIEKPMFELLGQPIYNSHIISAFRNWNIFICFYYFKKEKEGSWVHLCSFQADHCLYDMMDRHTRVLLDFHRLAFEALTFSFYKQL